MFGIGGSELIIIAFLLLVVVGPDRMPNMVRSVAKGVREFRRSASELQKSVGLDQVLKDPDVQAIKDLRRDPLGVKQVIREVDGIAAGKSPVNAPATASARRRKVGGDGPRENELTDAEYLAEQPPESIDVAWAARGDKSPEQELSASHSVPAPEETPA